MCALIFGSNIRFLRKIGGIRSVIEIEIKENKREKEWTLEEMESRIDVCNKTFMESVKKLLISRDKWEFEIWNELMIGKAWK